MNKNIFLILLGIITLISSATATYFFSNKKPENNDISENKVLSAQDNATFLSNPEFKNKNTFAILLLGYGGAGHEGGYLSDVIQIVYFDFENQKISFISIPRDLYVALPNGSTEKINKAFSMGNSDDPIHSGAQIAKQMVTTVTGIPIDAFISVDFVGFQVAIGGILEGLDVNIREDLDDPWYPVEGKQLDTCGKSPEEVAELTNTLSGFELEKQFECRYERLQYSVGISHMEGGEALAYVRSRHGSASGDFSRSKRQHDILLAIREKLFSLHALENIPEFFKTMIAITDTDLDINIISTLAPKLITTQNMETKSITLSTQNVFQNSKSPSGAFIVIPKSGLNNWEETTTFVKKELNK